VVVDVDSLRVFEGEVLAILGPNGAGKTTLFRILALLERPDSGWISYYGKRVDTHDLAARRRTAAVFQRPLLFQGTVEENVGFGLRFRRSSRKEVKSKVHQTLDFMGISHLAGADMRTLSGGSCSGWRSPGPWYWSPTSSSSMSLRATLMCTCADGSAKTCGA
jgi:tungstate transport system ATP-binding protein